MNELFNTDIEYMNENRTGESWIQFGLMQLKTYIYVIRIEKTFQNCVALNCDSYTCRNRIIMLRWNDLRVIQRLEMMKID